MHDFIIGLVIAAVVAIQVLVGVTAWKKIDLYKTIIPESQSFKTVKVYIREDEVKNIDVSYVLNNLNKYGVPDSYRPDEPVYAEVIEQKGVVGTQIGEQLDFDEDEQEEEQHDDASPGGEDLIWVSRGNEEMKIKYKLLASHEEAGWLRI